MPGISFNDVGFLLIAISFRHTNATIQRGEWELSEELKPGAGFHLL